jgi:hypothetical protein
VGFQLGIAAAGGGSFTVERRRKGVGCGRILFPPGRAVVALCF